MFIAAGSIMVGSGGLIGVAVAQGLAIALMVTAFGHISGGHFNPAITLGFLVTRRITLALAGVYWLVQFAGAVVASLLLWWIFPADAIAPARLGAPLLHPSIGSGAGFALEAIMTFFLVITVFATAVDDRGAFKAVAGFGIGLVLTMDILVRWPADRRGDEPRTRVRPRARLQRLGELHLDLLRRPLRGRHPRGRPLRSALSPAQDAPAATGPARAPTSTSPVRATSPPRRS